MNWPILSTVTYLPLVGAAIIFFFIHGDGPAHPAEHPATSRSA